MIFINTLHYYKLQLNSFAYFLYILMPSCKLFHAKAKVNVLKYYRKSRATDFDV